jgi:hypothetical protein
MASYEQLTSYFQTNVPGGNVNPYEPEWNDRFNQWIGEIMADLGVSSWEEVPIQELDNYEYVGPTSQPAEQFLGEEALRRALEDMSRDPARRAEAQAIIDQLNRDYDAALANNRSALDGSRYAEELAQVGRSREEMLAAIDAEAAERAAAIDAQTAQLRQGLDALTTERQRLLDEAQTTTDAAITARNQARIAAIDAETAQLRQGITDLEVQRMASLEELAAARQQAASTVAAGVNQGLERTLDDLDAERALQGYVGRSSGDVAAATRATVEARQRSAEIGAEALLANANDRRGVRDEISGLTFDLTSRDAAGRRGIADEDASSRFDLATMLANERRRVGDESALAGYGITGQDAGLRFTNASDAARLRREAENTATGLRQTYFDNDFTRRQAATLLPLTIGRERLAMVGAADEAGYQGLRRGLDTLNWFSAEGSMPSSQPFYRQPSTEGADLAGLGAGLVSSGFNLAASNGSWFKPKAKTPSSNADIDTGLSYV